jgi:hypothetical protein
MGITHRWTRRGVAVIAAAAALTAVMSSPAGAGGVRDKKTFTADVDGSTVGSAPAAWAGDVDATIRVVLENTSKSQKLGSANVTVPAPFQLVSAPADAVPGGPVVELRNLALAPGASMAAVLTVDVRSCAASPGAAFGITAKQSNDYSGTGNDFYLKTGADLQVEVTGPCTLAFLAPPADAETGKVVTSVAWSPLAPSVTVEVRDAGSIGRIGGSTPVGNPIVVGFGANPGAATLGGTTAASPVAGVASFAPTVDVSAFDYTLVAASTGLSAAPASPTFDIVDDRAGCPAGGACEPATASKNGQTVTANFGAGGAPTNLLVSLGAADAPVFECANYPRTPGTLVAQYLFTGGTADDRLGTFTGTIPNATKPLHEYEVCWAAPYDFKTDGGLMASATPDLGDGTTKPGTTSTLFVGTLPDCSRRHSTIPCVESRCYQKSTKTVTITVRADGRDPFRY